MNACLYDNRYHVLNQFKLINFKNYWFRNLLPIKFQTNLIMVISNFKDNNYLLCWQLLEDESTFLGANALEPSILTPYKICWSNIYLHYLSPGKNIYLI